MAGYFSNGNCPFAGQVKKISAKRVSNVFILDFSIPFVVSSSCLTIEGTYSYDIFVGTSCRINTGMSCFSCHLSSTKTIKISTFHQGTKGILGGEVCGRYGVGGTMECSLKGW